MSFLRAKSAVFGGTFNPIHEGHIQVLKYVSSIRDLKSIVVVLSSLPPHKDKRKLMSYRHRFSMLAKAIRPLLKRDNKYLNDPLNRKIVLSTIERNMNSAGYTYNILKALQGYCRENNIAVILGEDMYHTLPSWYNAEKLITEFEFMVIRRNTDKAIQIKSRNFFILDNSVWDFSSTTIRQKLSKYWKDPQEKNLSDLRNMMNKNVLDYILENRLYV